MTKRPSDDLAESKPKRTTKSKTFKGNFNYVSFYNKEAENFFNPKPIPWGMSYIARSGDIRHLKERGPIQCGTYWSSEEKEIFFQILARVSIHRIDLLKEHLKDKSETEIFEYYDLLRKNVETMSKSSYKYQLVKFQDMPISHEMSHSFITMEEKQAEALMLFDRKKENNLVWRTDFEQLASQHSLIDFEGTTALTRQFYLKHGVTDHQFESSRGCKFPRLVKSSYAMIDELVRLITADVISHIIEEKVSSMWRSSDKIDKEIPVLPGDVYRALSRTQIGVLNRCTDFNAHPSLYLKKMPERLNLKLTGQRQNRNTKYLKSEADKHDVELLYQKVVFEDAPLIEAETDVSFPRISDEEKEDRLVPSKLIHISQLSRVGHNKADADQECDDSVIDAKDLEQSREYEHVLLTWLATFNQPTLLTEDEARSYLEDVAINGDGDFEAFSMEESSMEESSGESSEESSEEDFCEEKPLPGVALSERVLEHAKEENRSDDGEFSSGSFSSGSFSSKSFSFLD